LCGVRIDVIIVHRRKKKEGEGGNSTYRPFRPRSTKRPLSDLTNSTEQTSKQVEKGSHAVAPVLHDITSSVAASTIHCRAWARRDPTACILPGLSTRAGRLPATAATALFSDGGGCNTAISGPVSSSDADMALMGGCSRGSLNRCSGHADRPVDGQAVGGSSCGPDLHCSLLLWPARHLPAQCKVTKRVLFWMCMGCVGGRR